MPPIRSAHTVRRYGRSTAVATTGRADYLLTWNCRHIANTDTLPVIQRTIVRAGYDAPVITTPSLMLESRHEN